MKTKIILHGKLRKLYGESFEFANIKKPIDAVQALDVIFPGFRKSVINEAKEGGHYEIIANGESQSCLELTQNKKRIEQIDITPCLVGSGPGGFIAILGAFAVGIGVYGGLSVAVSAFFIALGVGLIIAGIMYLMTPIPENEPNEQNIRASVRNSSFLFQNPQNTTTQGRPVPIVYGKLRVGSHVIGTTITNFSLHEDSQLQRRFKSNRTNALLKIQKAFGSSISELYRTL
jgi:predicted phage tail protein